MAEALRHLSDPQSRRALLSVALKRWLSVDDPSKTCYATLEALAEGVRNDAAVGGLVAKAFGRQLVNLSDMDAPARYRPQLAALAVQATVAAGSAAGQRELLDSLGPRGSEKLLSALGPRFDLRADMSDWTYGVAPDIEMRIACMNQLLETVTEGPLTPAGDAFLTAAINYLGVAGVLGATVDDSYRLIAKAAAQQTWPNEPDRAHAKQGQLFAALRSPVGQAVLAMPGLSAQQRLRLLDLADGTQLTSAETRLTAELLTNQALTPEQQKVAIDVVVNMKLPVKQRDAALSQILAQSPVKLAKALDAMSLEDRRNGWHCNLQKNQDPLTEPFLTPPAVKNHLHEINKWVDQQKAGRCLTISYQEVAGARLFSGEHDSGKRHISMAGPADTSALDTKQAQDREQVYLHELGHQAYQDHCVDKPASQESYVAEYLLCEADAILFATSWLFAIESRTGRSVELLKHFNGEQEKNLRTYVQQLNATQISRDEARQRVAKMIQDSNAGGWVTYYQDGYKKRYVK